MPTIKSVPVRAVRKLGNRIGRRGASLLFLGLIDIGNAVSLIFPTPRQGSSPVYLWLDRIMPLWVWGSTWVFTAVLCLVYAFTTKGPKGYRDWPAFSSAIAVKAFWVLIIIFGWLNGEIERGWFSALVWGGFACFVGLLAGWRENNER